jgi:hypothetical protein
MAAYTATISAPYWVDEADIGAKNKMARPQEFFLNKNKASAQPLQKNHKNIKIITNFNYWLIINVY